MDIAKRLESEHSKALTLAIIEFIGHNKKRFRLLMTVFLKGTPLLSQRAAWPLSYVCIAHPAFMIPYMDQFIAKLKEENNHPAIARSILRVFQETGVPDKYQGPVVDLCFKHIMSPSSAIAVRAFAITTAANICRPYPELRNELLLILKELRELPQPAAVKQRAKLALKQLSGMDTQL